MSMSSLTIGAKLLKDKKKVYIYKMGSRQSSLKQKQQKKQQTKQRATTQGQQLRNKRATTPGQQLRNKRTTTQGQQQQKNQSNQQGKQQTNQQKQPKKSSNQNSSFGNMLRKNLERELARKQQNVSSTSNTPQKNQTQQSRPQQQRQNNENILKQNMFNRIKNFICKSTNPVVKNRICNSTHFLQNMQLTGLENILRNFRNLQLRPSHGMGIFSNIDLKAGDEIIVDFNTIAYNYCKIIEIKKAIKFYSGDEFTKTHALSKRNFLFPITGLLNYSDNPNCLSLFIPFKFRESENYSYEIGITHCIKDIKTGEELTISYDPGFAFLVEEIIKLYFLNNNIDFKNKTIPQKLNYINDKLLKRRVPLHYNFIDNRCSNQLFLYLCENLIMKIGDNNFSKNKIINVIFSYNNVYLGTESMAFLEKLIEIYETLSSSASSMASPFTSPHNLDRIYSLYNDPRLQNFKTLMRPSFIKSSDLAKNVTYLTQYIETQENE